MAAIAAAATVAIGDSLPMSTWTAADATAASALGIGALADGIIAMTPTMNVEAVWEATIVTDNRVMMKLRQPVYIRDADMALYDHATNLDPMASWTTTEPLRGRLIRYDP